MEHTAVRTTGRLHRDERGVNMVEFAITLLLLLTIMFGTIEFGRVFNAYVVLANSVREGARVGSLGGSAGAIEARVVATAGSLNPADISVTTVNAGGSSGSTVTVTGSYSVEVVVPLIADLLPQNPILMESTASMRIE